MSRSSFYIYSDIVMALLLHFVSEIRQFKLPCVSYNLGLGGWSWDCIAVFVSGCCSSLQSAFLLCSYPLTLITSLSKDNWIAVTQKIVHFDVACLTMQYSHILIIPDNPSPGLKISLFRGGISIFFS